MIPLICVEETVFDAVVETFVGSKNVLVIIVSVGVVVSVVISVGAVVVSTSVIKQQLSHCQL